MTNSPTDTRTAWYRPLTHHLVAIACYAVVLSWAVGLDDTTLGWMLLAGLMGLVLGAQLMLIAHKTDA